MSLIKAIINCLVLKDPKYKKQNTNETGKVIIKSEDKSQNFIKFISLNEFFSFIEIFNLLFPKLTFLKQLDRFKLINSITYNNKLSKIETLPLFITLA